jgi:hypothetical protein
MKTLNKQDLVPYRCYEYVFNESDSVFRFVLLSRVNGNRFKYVVIEDSASYNKARKIGHISEWDFYTTCRFKEIDNPKAIQYARFLTL